MKYLISLYFIFFSSIIIAQKSKSVNKEKSMAECEIINIKSPDKSLLLFELNNGINNNDFIIILDEKKEGIVSMDISYYKTGKNANKITVFTAEYFIDLGYVIIYDKKDGTMKNVEKMKEALDVIFDHLKKKFCN